MQHVSGIKKSKIEKMAELMTKYPFLEKIIKNQPYKVFNITEAKTDDTVYSSKCHNHGSEGPESFDEQFYFVNNGEAEELGVKVINPTTGETIPKDPSPTVLEELASKEIKPNFLVKAHHLKYEIKPPEHNHDITITIYKT